MLGEAASTATMNDSPGTVAWHALSAEDALARLASSPAGLTDGEAATRLARVGPNSLPREAPDGWATLLWRQINSPLIWVLIASGGIAMIADWSGDGIKNGLVILAVVVLNSLIGFVQEFKAGRAIESLAKMMPELVTAQRSGVRVTVPASDVVPGDVVLLSPGDRVPADGRVLACRALRIDEAALTGESVSTEKAVAAVATDAGIGDRACAVFGGTLVTSGSGTVVIHGTGAATELGRISKLIGEAQTLETPLTAALRRIAGLITIGILAVTALMLVVGCARAMIETGASLGAALAETVIFAIALAVGAIPEGLPAIVTIALAIGVQRMSHRRAIVRRLPAVETLGSTTVICSDKTGTLTRNEMTTQRLWTPEGWVHITGVGYSGEGAFTDTAGQPLRPSRGVLGLLEAGVLCSDARLIDTAGTMTAEGDPTEVAIIVAGRKAGLREDELRAGLPRLDAIAFESGRSYMATLHAGNGGDRALVKGAPEVVAGFCEGIDRAALAAEVESMARDGMRVLAVAERTGLRGGRLEESDVTAGLRLLGLIGMIDPPRPEAREAIRACAAAGIRVKMITGDHRTTATSIGRDLGLLGPTEEGVASSSLIGLDDAAFTEAVTTRHVFARVAPEHKLRIVTALQKTGAIVAMTGDGVNDAPALKQANIGVAMGITGTAVSKEAADIVLTDDNFASITAAVEEGRRVFDNLVKSLAFVLPTNIGLALILIAAVAFFPRDAATGALLMPMSPLQLLWINLVATVALALPLAFEVAEPDVMARPPRNPGAPVLTPLVLWRTAVVAVLMAGGSIAAFIVMGGIGSAEAVPVAQTAAVTTVVLFQIFYMINCRSLRGPIREIGFFSNVTVPIGIGALLVLQVLFIYAGPLQAVFSSAALDAKGWLICTGIGVVVWPMVAVEKWARTRRDRAASAAAAA